MQRYDHNIDKDFYECFFVFLLSGFLKKIRCNQMEKIIFSYYQQMKSIDPNFNWSNKYWWKDTNNAKVILSGNKNHPKGFCIIGYNHLIDVDVKSEICELYCTNPFLLLPLLRSSMKHIDYPFGFQVLTNNQRAIKIFELILIKFKADYKKIFATDGNSKVFKYRISSTNFTS